MFRCCVIGREVYIRHIQVPVSTPQITKLTRLVWQQEVEHLHPVAVYLYSDTFTLIQCYPPYLLSSGGESYREVGPVTAGHGIVPWWRRELNVNSSCIVILSIFEVQEHVLATTQRAVCLYLQRYILQVEFNPFATCNWFPTCVLWRRNDSRQVIWSVLNVKICGLLQ